MQTVIRRLGLLFLAIGFVPGMAWPATPDRTVFGIAIGEPLNIPECSKYGFDLLHIPGPCAKSWGTIKETGEVKMTVWFPTNQTPSIVKSFPPVQISVLEGKVEYLFFSTRGISSQEDDLAQLKAKYGRPHKIDRPRMQNALGAEFGAYRASWTFPGLLVQFEGTTGSIDEGRVKVITPRYKAIVEEWSKKKEEGRPKL